MRASFASLPGALGAFGAPSAPPVAAAPAVHAPPAAPASAPRSAPRAMGPMELDLPQRPSSGGMRAVPQPQQQQQRPQGNTGAMQRPGPGGAQQHAARQGLAMPGIVAPSNDDLDFSNSGSSALELDVAPPPTSARRPPTGMDAPMSQRNVSGTGSMSGRIDLAPSSSQSFGSRSDLVSSSSRGSRRDLLSEEEIVDSEAIQLANYGDPPGKWWKAPTYAFRVYKRQNDLKLELAKREEDFAAAKKELEAALASLGQRARPTAEKISGYRPSMDALAAAEALLRSRDGQAMAARDVQNKKVAEVDQRIAEMEKALALTFAEQRGLEGDVARAQEAVNRLDAQEAAARTGNTGAVSLRGIGTDKR